MSESVSESEPTQPELPWEDDGVPLPWYVIAAFVVTVVAGFAVAVWFVVTWGSGCADIGGKTTNVAGDSTRSMLCQSGNGVAALLIPAGWVAGLVLATLALHRWGGGGVRAVLLALLFVTPVLLPAAAYAGLNRSDTQCPDDKLHAYREWVDDGSKGPAPYDCRTY